jgi:hypothetical protein
MSAIPPPRGEHLFPLPLAALYRASWYTSMRHSLSATRSRHRHHAGALPAHAKQRSPSPRIDRYGRPQVAQTVSGKRSSAKSTRLRNVPQSIHTSRASASRRSSRTRACGMSVSQWGQRWTGAERHAGMICYLKNSHVRCPKRLYSRGER